ncbi:MAG: rhodanese-like domain-containing protein, partial [Nocardioides sp.]
ATGGPPDWSEDSLASFPLATFADLARARERSEVVVLDVRRADEHAAARIAGAVNIPIHELPQRLDEVPVRRGAEVWVHCAGGYRASVAASFLSAAGHALVAIDDSFENAREVNLHLVGPEA